MAWCRNMRRDITRDVLIPVTRAVTELQEKCDQVQRWIEEEIIQPVEQWISTQEQTCRARPWWDPQRWLCEMVMIVIKVIVWSVVTVGKWAVVTVCRTITMIVYLTVNTLLRTVLWTVAFVACVFDDPGVALESLPDLFGIPFDIIGKFIDHTGTWLGDLAGMLDDAILLTDSIASSLGPLGGILGVLRGPLSWARRVLDIGRDMIDGLKDVVLGVLQGNACRFERGGSNFAVATGRSLLMVPQAVGALNYGFRDLTDLATLETTITNAVNGAFGAGTERATRSLSRIGIGAHPMGLVFEAEPYRMFLSSRSATLDLAELSRTGVIDLVGLAGYAAECKGDVNNPQGEVVYAGTNVRVTSADLSTFMTYGPDSVAPFQVFAISKELFRRHLDVAKRKALALGVQLRFGLIGEFEATSSRHIPLDATELDDSFQQEMFEQLGRTGIGDDLSRVPIVSHFRYASYSVPVTDENGVVTSKLVDLQGLASSFGSPKTGVRSGVTYRNRSPEWVYRFVLAHEIGHYWGLQHPNLPGPLTNPAVPLPPRNLDEIMFRPGEGEYFSGKMVFEYLMLGGEPRFTPTDASTVWSWITGPGASSLLP